MYVHACWKMVGVNEMCLLRHCNSPITGLDTTWVFQISRRSEHKGGKVVGPKHRSPLPPKEIFLVLISIRSWVNSRAIVGPEELCQRKLAMTPPGIEPATFRLDQLCHGVPHGGWSTVVQISMNLRY